MDEAPRYAPQGAQPPSGGPPWQPPTGAWQQTRPPVPQQEPWRDAEPLTPWHLQPLPPWRAEPQGNPVAVWSWVVALPCAVLGLVLGVLGISRARRRGGAGMVHAVVGTALSGAVLVAGGAGLAVGAGALVASLPQLAGGRGHDDSVTSLSAAEQAFIDDLYEDTYLSWDDATLVDMARGFCADMDAGASPQQADAALVQRWAPEGLDLDAAYDVEVSATTALCEQHAEEFRAWDPSTTDPSAPDPQTAWSTALVV